MHQLRVGHADVRIEYSSDYSGATGSLWFYSKDELILLTMLQIRMLLNLSAEG